MLSQWLAPMTVETFTQTHLRRMPFALPGAARSAVELLDWETLGRVLAAHPPPDVLVASRGRLVDVPPPRSLALAKHLMQQELGVAVRRSERHEAKLAGLAAAFAQDLPGQVQVQLYATPAGTQTFGWHFDMEDVFIVQTAGVKDYYLRQNTVAPPFSRGQKPDFSLVRQETSPLHCCRLLVGDWLYIPSRWWHLVKSVEDALSISIGVYPKLADAVRTV